MKAAYIEGHGGPEALKYGDRPDPVAGADEVVVDIHAASINGADWKVRAGGSIPQSAFPYILGRDFSGVVSAVGEDVDDLQIGDHVFAVCDAGQEGAYAEQIAIKASIVAHKPEDVSHVDACALALTGLTALIAVEDTLHLESGETILIQGGAGGVAGFAIELAKHLGARVITTASATNHEYLRELGADEIIDYQKEDFTELVSDCDAVFETVGGDVAERSFEVIRPGGRIAFIASGVGLESPRADVTSLRPRVDRDRPHLDRIVELLRLGAIHAPEITRYSLADAEAAHRVSEDRHLRGKLVFEIR
ncbi:MAG TPA: NADP-dependent oxidoreductase [Dehalococcoidia bacterium]|jgi:NADPH:quinone reductase-like Zn-dependent oxidoreductase|nr:NADP-dependent oxidoreductase [Dehalococcoidia bacterium]